MSYKSGEQVMIDYFFTSLAKFINNKILKPIAIVVGAFFGVLLAIWGVLFLMLLVML